MRILAIAPEPFFSPRGTPLSVYYRTSVLAELGHEIDLLTYGQGHDVDLPGVSIIRIPAFRRLGPVRVGPSMLKLFLDIVLMLRLVGLLTRNRYDVLHAHEEAVFLCRLLRPFFRFKMVYDMHSSLPQQLTNFEFTHSRILIALFRRLEKSCLQDADAVITISPALAEYALSLMPRPDRHFLIENSISDPVRLKSRFEAEESFADLLQRLPEGREIICYAGTFEPYQGVDLLLSAFAEVRQRRPQAFLLLIGGTEVQRARQQELAARLELEGDTLFAGSQPLDTARRLMAESQVLVSPRTVGSNTPLKVYELLASGKPIVATRILAHTQILSDETCHLAAPEPTPFADALVRALDNDEGTRRRTRAARELFERHYSRSRYVEKMKDLTSALQ